MNRALSITILLVAAYLPLVATAQRERSGDVMTDLSRQMQDARTRPTSDGSRDTFVTNEQIRGTDPIAFLQQLDIYLEEDNENVHRDTYSIMYRIATVHDSLEARQAVADRLVAAIDAPWPFVQRLVRRKMGGFVARDFTPQAKQRLRELAHTAPPLPGTFLKSV